MTTRTRLDGGWTMKGYLSPDWAVEAARNGWHGEGWIEASVPGSVAHDVWQAEGGPSPYVERGSLAWEWVSERAWRYHRSIAVPRLRDGERARLRFEGIDHEARVLLDGVELARHEGMFVPFEVELPADVAGRRVRLDVVVGPAPASESQLGRTSRVRVHKSRMSYGWDFCPRLVHQGIWRPVWLETGGPAVLGDVWARTRWSEQPGGHARVECRVTVQRSGDDPVGIEAQLHDRERLVERVSGDVPRSASRIELSIDVPSPRPWRPNGLGDAVVHRLEVRLLGQAGSLDRRVVPVGFRDATLVPNVDGPPAARPYTLEVDGRRMYANGWNWTPLDVFHGVPRPGHREHLIRMAQSAHVNLLRVWGGGLIEDEAFYDACDAAGIFVWQELSLSSSQVDSVPAADEEFVEHMRAEARRIVPRLRNHPSLLLWCGGNELADERPLDEERAPVLAALRDVVRELDPDRAFLPTSPSGPRFHNRLEDIAADPDGLWDVHGPWEHQGLTRHNTLYDRGTSLLNSEFGVEGMANRRQHEAVIGPGHRWPATRANPVYRHLGDWWINEPLVQEAFGGRIAGIDTLRRASQHLQADGLRYAVEANRRRWPRNSGSLPWQLNESYPNAWSTAVIDHRGDPKPAFFGVARAYRPAHVCARFERWAWDGQPFTGELWAWSGAVAPEQPRPAAVRAAVRELDGGPLVALEAPVAALDDRPRCVGSLDTALPPRLAVVDLGLVGDDDLVLATNRYVVSGTENLAPLLDLAAANVEITCDRGDDAWRLELTHRSGPAALGIVIDDDRPIDAPGWAEASDGAIDLLPGERRAVDVGWAGAPPHGRRLRVHGWNFDGVVG